ncbi:MAG: hypothetical protein QXU94_01790, partial [Thermoplasmata archaeon]
MIPEELLNQIENINKKKGLIYAIKGDNFKEITISWMGINYILPGLLEYDDLEIEKQRKIYNKLVDYLKFQ